jgi:hypothetical protein
VGEQDQLREQARVTLGLDRGFIHNLYIFFEVTWQQEDLFFKSGENFSAICFRFRLFYSWGDRE